MAKFFGEVGYGHAIEEPPGSGVWKDVMVAREYFGEVLRNTRKLDSGESLNSDISVGNSISIVADAFAIEHFMKIKYIRWMGVLWTVTTVEPKHPRLILSLGEVYNGATP
mgnify:CR=1 FL=1